MGTRELYDTICAVLTDYETKEYDYDIQEEMYSLLVDVQNWMCEQGIIN